MILKGFMLFSLLFSFLLVTGCSSKSVKKTVKNSDPAELNAEQTIHYAKIKNLETVTAESLHLKTLEFPYIDQVKHKVFLDSYFKQKSEQSSIMSQANMILIKSKYFQNLNKFEHAYEIHKEKKCSDVKVSDSIKKQFTKALSPQYIKDNKNLIKETIVANYLKNVNNCNHINQDLYQHSMLENLTLEIRLVDDMLKYYKNYTGEKSSDLKEDIKGLESLKETCSKYFALILPNELDEFFMQEFQGQLDSKVIKFLSKNFKGKPFDSIVFLDLVKDF